jgi:alpha-tubulin suppressor-like RCC1 family protein
VRSWGWNVFGQLGDGTLIDRPTPVPAGFGVPVDGISAGLLHSVAVGNGRAFGWGWNGFGQLGDGTTSGRSLPKEMAGPQNAYSAAAGAYHSLVAATSPAL